MSPELRKILQGLRDAIADTQKAHYESGWYKGQPMTLAEHGSAIVKDHFAKLEADCKRATADCNRSFAQLLVYLGEIE